LADIHVCLRNDGFIGYRWIFVTMETGDGYACNGIFYMSPTDRPIDGFNGISNRVPRDDASGFCTEVIKINGIKI
jgi:hypothetical protein